MSKDKSKNLKPVDLYVDEILGDKVDETTNEKPVVKRLLNIPYKPDKKPKAFRIYKQDKEQLLYASTRIGTLEVNDENNPGNFVVDVTNLGDLVGKECELKDIEKKEVVLRGKITEKKAQSNIVSINTAVNTGAKSSTNNKAVNS